MKKLIAHMPTFIALVFGAFIYTGMAADQALAQTGLISVSFESTPLFSASDVKPGDMVTKSVTVTNTSSESQNVYLELLNCTQAKGLGDALDVSANDGSTTFFSGSALTSLCDVRTALTASLAPEASATYRVAISFPSMSGNEYQLGTAGFDFCIGFSGGAFNCDGSTEGEGGGEGNSGGGGASGGSSGTRHLIITNEHPDNVDTPPGRADLVWITNLPATSKIVCRPAGTLMTFTLSDTDTFGYPIALEENPTLSETHLYALGGLSPGTYYCRVASRLGPGEGWTVSDEFPFTIVSGNGPGVGVTTVAPTFGASQAFTAASGARDTDGAGATESSEETSGTEITGPGNAGDTQAAAAFLAFPELADLLNFGICGNEWWVWIVIGLMLLLSTLWRERFIYAIGIVPEPIRRFFVFGGFGLALSLFGWILGLWFILIPIMIGSIALFAAGGVDYFLTHKLMPARRLIYDTLSIILILIGVLILALFRPWLCSILPLIVIIGVLLIRLGFHFLHLRRNN